MSKEPSIKVPQTTPPKSNQGNVILRFTKVSFNYGAHTILNEVDLVVRERAKLALMGQNGAGKTTIFKLISEMIEPEEGAMHKQKDASVALAMQVMPRERFEDTVQEFFESAFQEKIYDIKPRIEKILEVVHLDAPLEKKVKAFSGGEQARLLLAYALIQNPDILLLDEPTNNLDKEGIHHLTQFLIEYKKTCIVISHDAQFLNAFTEGVLYLDVFTHKVEQYVGNYLTVVEEITRRIERERMKNVRLERDIANRKEQHGFFAQKGGKMRDVARKMKEAIEELEEQIVEMREEDKTIRQFAIPVQSLENLEVPIFSMNAVTLIKKGKQVKHPVTITLKKRDKLLIAGPNGIGKSTLLESIAEGKAKGVTIAPGVVMGYYRQDFSGLPYSETAYRVLGGARNDVGEETLRSIAAQFLLTDEVLKRKVEMLSEGQKGLLMMAYLVLLRPGLLILDEPTNHINFRHLPVIAKALDKYEGALIVVSHMKEFVEQINFTQTLDLGKLN